MEIEKKRETSWKIQLKEKNENIEMTSVEISGEVRIIKLALLKNEKTVKVKMNKEEFFNFLSLLSAFKDVVIGEDSIILDEGLSLIESKPQQSQDSALVIQDLYQINPEPTEGTLEEKEREDELDPEEWDPW